MTRAREAGARVVALVFIAAVALLGGCSSYALQGKVIYGDASYMSVVNADDPRFDEQGIPGVQLELVTDPDRLNRKRVGSAVTDGDGWFSITVDEVGAGFLEYDVGLNAQREGFARADHAFRLPPRKQRVLVILRRGVNTPGDDPEDLLEEYRRFNR